MSSQYHSQVRAAARSRVALPARLPSAPAMIGEPPIARRCLNPACRDGYAPRRAGGMGVCAGCDGLGYIRSTPDNRKLYYTLRAAASELEAQSRARRAGSGDKSAAGGLDFGALLGELSAADAESDLAALVGIAADERGVAVSCAAL